MGIKTLQSDSIMSTPEAGETAVLSKSSDALPANSTKLSAKERDVADLFASLKNAGQIIAERAASDPDCAHIVLGDTILNKMSNLRDEFIAAPDVFDCRSALEFLKSCPRDEEVTKGIHRCTYHNAKKYLSNNANGRTHHPSDYETKKTGLNLVAGEYFETLENLRTLVRTDRECAEIIVRNRQWLTYCTPQGDLIAHDVARNTDDEFVLKFVEQELREPSEECALALPDDYGWTPLHWVAMRKEAAQYIMALPPERRAELTGITDRFGKSVGDVIKVTMASEEGKAREEELKKAIARAMGEYRAKGETTGAFSEVFRNFEGRQAAAARFNEA